MHRSTWTIGVLASCVALAACSTPTSRPSTTPSAQLGERSGTPSTPGPEGQVIQLPEPRTDGGMSLERALRERRSVRGFTAEPLTLDEVSQLLWAAQGITASWGGRTAPSAGALYPLEVYVATADGLSHYLPDGHRMEVVSVADVRPALGRAAYEQTAVVQAPVVFAITAVPARTAARYGERAERYVQLEAGHAAQNVLLQAVALGLAGVPIGAFIDEEVARVLELPSGTVPLYLIPIGHAVEA